MTFYTEGETPGDLLPSVIGDHVVSERVAAVFQELGGEGVECLPVRVVRRETGEEVPGYRFVHVLREVAAFDRRHGTYSEDAWGLSVVRKALRLEAVAGLHVFRMVEAWSAVIVSAELVKRLRLMKACGFLWLPVRAYPPE
ncbi:MAG: imm11 family protein [Anaerolineae bacterium]